MNTELINILPELIEGFNLFEEELHKDKPKESATEQPPNPLDEQQQHNKHETANVGNEGLRQPLQQLLQVLRSPNTPEQQQQILHLLKSNAGLLRAFIDCRNAMKLYRQQQQQQQ